MKEGFVWMAKFSEPSTFLFSKFPDIKKVQVWNSLIDKKQDLNVIWLLKKQKKIVETSSENFDFMYYLVLAIYIITLSNTKTMEKLYASSLI